MLTRISILVLGIAASILVATQHFAHAIRINAPTVSEAPAEGRTGIVVATGGAGRIAAGIALMRRDIGTRMLISGTGEGVKKSDIIRLVSTESSAGQINQLMNCCVDLGPMATNTSGNAEEAGRWAKANHIDHLIVVTSDYHLPRAMIAFNRQLDDVTLLPHAVPTSWLALTKEGRSGWWTSARRAGIIASEMIKYYARTLGLN